MGATSSVSSYVSDQSHADNITGKIMVSAVIFLFVVVLFVLLLHLYAKWFWWRIEETTTTPQPQSSSHRRRRRRFVFAPGQDPFIYGTNQNIGLDPSILKSIPVLVFQPEHFKDGLECAVCLSELVQGEKARLLPKCHHGFHVDCIDMWFHSHSTCPLCRNLVAYESSIQNQNCSSSVRENVSENSTESLLEVENSVNMSDLESPNFPTYVLVWGNQNQVSCVDASSFEEGTSQQPPCSSSSTSSSGMLVIDIPSECNSSSWCAEDEMKSPMTARLRSLKRLLSRDKKLSSPNCSPSSMDNVEHAQS